MDKAKHQLIIQAINEKLGPRKLVCPISGDGATWEVLTNSTLLPVIEVPGDPPPFGHYPTFPLAVLMCKDCGYFMLINLIVLGVAEELDIPVSIDD